MKLSPQQHEAKLKLQAWLLDYTKGQVDRPFFVIQGLAGTGKTTMIKDCIDDLQLYPYYMAYTGKAAMVMNKYNNVAAQTIHSAIYELQVPSEEAFKKLYEEKDNASTKVDLDRIQGEIDTLLKPTFVLKQSPFKFLQDKLTVIILDECSMVDKEMLDDLLSFNLPIIALGDQGQLPPVSGTGVLFNGKIDAQLTEIHRQASDNKIIEWATKARTGIPLPQNEVENYEPWTDDVAKVHLKMLNKEQEQKLFSNTDVLLCWKNETRMMFNQMYRNALGFAAQDYLYPVPGDKIIFTKNDKVKGVFNGMGAEVLAIGPKSYSSTEYKVKLETDRVLTVDILNACFEQYDDPQVWSSLKVWDYRNTQQADFGYALTVHKAQGSQWNNVLIYDDNVLNWPGKRAERNKWLYTAITRAVEKITIFINSGKVTYL